MQFRPHGSFDFRIDGLVLRIAVAGSLNQEGLLAYRAMGGSYFAAMAGAPWGVLAVIAEGGFLLDGTREAMIEAIKRQQSSGRCATAVVLLDTVDGRSIFEERLHRFYSETGQAFALFSNEAAAREWLIARVREVSGAGT
ncbi:MAG TPA: hypothetical protein PLW86_04530 [Rhodocyclaceae bacterium]|nr:hypothetical protein [Rhodocyclaceae bacterium]